MRIVLRRMTSVVRVLMRLLLVLLRRALLAVACIVLHLRFGRRGCRSVDIAVGSLIGHRNLLVLAVIGHGRCCSSRASGHKQARPSAVCMRA